MIKGHLDHGFTQLKNDFNESEVKSIHSLALHNRAVYVQWMQNHTVLIYKTSHNNKVWIITYYSMYRCLQCTDDKSRNEQIESSFSYCFNSSALEKYKRPRERENSFIINNMYNRPSSPQATVLVVWWIFSSGKYVLSNHWISPEPEQGVV